MGESATVKKGKFTREEWSWIMYDWANSAFATIMLAAVFPVFFMAMAGGEGSLGSAWWGWAGSIRMVIMAVCAPIVGAVIAYRGYKKRLFLNFLAFGILAHLFIVPWESWPMLLIGYTLANMFWTAGNIVYDSYLPDVTTKDRMDKVSGWGFAMGYIGGSTIPFIISIILLMSGSLGFIPFSLDLTTAVRISVVMTALWWGVFSIPMFKNVHHKHPVDVPEKGVLAGTFKNVAETAKKITKNKGMMFFIIAFFFYNDGVGAVMTMATAYGMEIGLADVGPLTDGNGMILALFVTQIVAMPCSILFGKLANKYSSINLILFAIFVYFLICITGFVMGFGLERGWFDYTVAMVLFWTLAFLVGTVQGGIQATSRAVWARIIPPEHSGEYFGFYEISGRLSGFLGPLLYATILATTGSASLGIIPIGIIFVVGFVLLIVGKKHINLRPVNEATHTA